MPATEPLLTTPEIEQIFSAEQRVQCMLDFEAALHSFMASEYADLMNKINTTGDYGKDTAASLKEALDKFVATQAW